MKKMLILLMVWAATPGHAQSVDCLIEARSVIDLVAPEDGLITEIMVGRGDAVARGDLLAQLDDDLESLQAELAEARARSELEIAAQETRLALREVEYGRAVQLRERNAISETAVEDAEIEVLLTGFALEEARLAQHLAEIELRQAQALVQRKQIRSPIDGIVAQVAASGGEFATEQTTILTLVEIDPLHVEVFAPAELFGTISEGAAYPVRLAAPLEGQFTAETLVVDRFLDSASGTFGVRLKLDNPDGAIPAGARCVVEFGAG